MKKVNFIITMFAIMFAALSFTACGSDNDDDATGGDSSEGYIEVKFNGKLTEKRLIIGCMPKLTQ